MLQYSVQPIQNWQRANGCIGPRGGKLAARRDVIAAVSSIREAAITERK